MRAAIFLTLLLCALLLPELAEGKKSDAGHKQKKDGPGRKPRKGEAVFSCANDGVWAFSISTSKLKDSFFPVRCDGVPMPTSGYNDSSSDNLTAVVELSMEGRVQNCAGLTADLMVQMIRCHWQPQCNITYKGGPHYLFPAQRGPPQAQCLGLQPDQIVLSYGCAAVAVPIRTLSSEANDSVKEKRGLIRSHEHQPWNYDGQPRRASMVTLLNPSPKGADLMYTIRSIDLADVDELSVTWADASRTTRSEVIHDIKNKTTYKVSDAEAVTFALEIKFGSSGGAGFVVCFHWAEKGTTISDACDGLIIPKTCQTSTEAKNEKKVKKDGKGKGKKEKNKNGKKDKQKEGEENKKGGKGKKGKKGEEKQPKAK